MALFNLDPVQVPIDWIDITLQKDRGPNNVEVRTVEFTVVFEIIFYLFVCIFLYGLLNAATVHACLVARMVLMVFMLMLNAH